MKSITGSSFFAGIGGTCLAFKQAGVNVKWANEIDKYACLTYRNNIKKTTLIEKDMRYLNVNEIPYTDILIAGFPCQPFSIAGEKAGFSDERGKIFFDLINIIKHKRNSVIFFENVKNLVSHNKGNSLKKIYKELKELGYHVKHEVLNTMEYGGLPQNRERIYIVGFLDEKAYNNFTFPNKMELKKGIHDIIEVKDKKNDSYYYERSIIYDNLKSEIKRRDTIYQWRRKYVRENKSKVCPTLTANMGTGGHNVPIILDNFGIRKLTPEECLKFQGFPEEFVFPVGMSKGNCYKQIGNSVSIPVVKRIAERIVKAIS